MLTGERRRWCYQSGDWNWPELGDANCIRKNFLYWKEKIVEKNWFHNVIIFRYNYIESRIKTYMNLKKIYS